MTEGDLYKKTEVWHELLKSDHRRFLDGMTSLALAPTQERNRFFEVLFECRAKTQCQLRERYGFVPQELLRSKAPKCSNDQEILDMLFKQISWMTFDLAISMSVVVRIHAVEPTDKDPTAIPALAALACLRSFPALLTLLMIIPDDDVRANTIAAVSGWVASKTSLTKARRLKILLEKAEGGKAFKTLLKELPAATSSALENLNPNHAVIASVRESLIALLQEAGATHGAEPVRIKESLVNLVTRTLKKFLLKQEGFRVGKDGRLVQDQHLPPSSPALDEPVVGDLEHHALNHQAEAAFRRVDDHDEIQAMFLEAKLAPREAEVIELLLEGVEGAVAAGKMGVKAGAYRVLKHAAISKLRQSRGLS